MGEEGKNTQRGRRKKEDRQLCIDLSGEKYFVGDKGRNTVFSSWVKQVDKENQKDGSESYLKLKELLNTAFSGTDVDNNRKIIQRRFKAIGIDNFINAISKNGKYPIYRRGDFQYIRFLWETTKEKILLKENRERFYYWTRAERLIRKLEINTIQQYACSNEMIKVLNELVGEALENVWLAYELGDIPEDMEMMECYAVQIDRLQEQALEPWYFIEKNRKELQCKLEAEEWSPIDPCMDFISGQTIQIKENVRRTNIPLESLKTGAILKRKCEDFLELGLDKGGYGADERMLDKKDIEQTGLQREKEEMYDIAEQVYKIYIDNMKEDCEFNIELATDLRLKNKEGLLPIPSPYAYESKVVSDLRSVHERITAINKLILRYDYTKRVAAALERNHIQVPEVLKNRIREWEDKIIGKAREKFMAFNFDTVTDNMRGGRLFSSYTHYYLALPPKKGDSHNK